MLSQVQTVVLNETSSIQYRPQAQSIVRHRLQQFRPPASPLSHGLKSFGSIKTGPAIESMEHFAALM